MKTFNDVNGNEHYSTECNGVEEKNNLTTSETTGYIATFEGEPVCEIDEKTYEKLGKEYRCL